MPILDKIGAGGLSLIGNTAAAVAQGFTNRRNRKFIAEQNQRDRDFQGHMFWTKRQQDLDDWHMQNQYNSPAQQMQRLREAGLNPHLVYGGGADNTAVMVRGSSVPTNSSMAPPPAINPLQNAGSMVAEYLQAKQTTQVTDNLKEQAELIKRQQRLTDAQALKTLVETDTGRFNLDQLNRLKDIAIEKAILDNQMVRTNIEATGDANFRANQKLPQELQQMSENILKTKLEQAQLRAQTAKTDAERFKISKEIESIEFGIQSGTIQMKINEEMLKLWKKGINPNDPIVYRQLGILIEKIIKEFEEDW